MRKFCVLATDCFQHGKRILSYVPRFAAPKSALAECDDVSPFAKIISALKL